MRNRTIHYVLLDEPNEYDEIATACGKYLGTVKQAQYCVYIQGRGKNQLTVHTPEEVNCPKCMRTKEWKEAVAKKFVDRMIK